MNWQGCWVASLLIFASIVDGQQSLYHLPWACSVVHSTGSLVGACTIFDETNVLVSVDNFNEKVKDSYKRYFEAVEDLHVYAGSNLMDPRREDSSSPNHQGKKGKKLYVVTGFDDRDLLWTDQVKDLSKNSEVEQDVYGIAFNVGILAVALPFTWTAWVQPILIPTSLPISKTNDYIARHEKDTWGKPDTCITYSWNQHTNDIRYHEVSYLTKDNCLDLFCSWSLIKCTFFPKKPYHACFKVRNII